MKTILLKDRLGGNIATLATEHKGGYSVLGSGQSPYVSAWVENDGVKTTVIIPFAALGSLRFTEQ